MERLYSMKPGRIYYNVDLTPQMMEYILPLLDFSREFIVVAGYAITGQLSYSECPICFSSLSEENSYWEDDQSRLRSDCCAAYVDDVDMFVGIEDEHEAYSLIFGYASDYPKYQVWLKDDSQNLRSRDVENWNIVMADNIDRLLESLDLSENEKETGREIIQNLRLLKPCCVCGEMFLPGGSTADTRQLCKECQDVFSKKEIPREDDTQVSPDAM
jgi:hypothetical protein